MHKYLRAIGFSEPFDRSDLEDMLQETLNNPTYRTYTTKDDESDALFAEFRLDCGGDFGITVCGEFNADEQFSFEYYFPYLYTGHVSSYEDCSVERRVDNLSFSGICDDLKVGVTIIFRLINRTEFLKHCAEEEFFRWHYRDMSDSASEDIPSGFAAGIPGDVPFGSQSGYPRTGAVSVSLSALSVEGTVMMPIMKSEADIAASQRQTVDRLKLMNAARQGDEDAIRDLTMSDMDNYNVILDRIQQEDLYSLVDTSFMPYGVECDLYSVLGEIVSVESTSNRFTGEMLYKMVIACNDLEFDLLISQKDLYGEPEAGRRFKGVVWMQGTIQYPV